jgi:hypothetical protein
MLWKGKMFQHFLRRERSNPIFSVSGILKNFKSAGDLQFRRF